MLDGDGVIQRLEIADGAARYARCFVQTPKLAAEEAAGRFVTPTWVTSASGLFANVGQHIQSTSQRVMLLPPTSAGTPWRIRLATGGLNGVK